MQTCSEVHELLASEMLKDLPVTRLRTDGAPTSSMAPVSILATRSRYHATFTSIFLRPRRCIY